MTRILVAGLGNIFFGDDGFGVAVAQRLATRQLPPGVTVLDLGIRGFDLAYRLLEGYDVVILVDAADRGLPPGTIQVIEPEWAHFKDIDNVLPQTHGMVPSRALEMARAMGAEFKTLRIVCCQPASLEPLATENGDLTPPVRAAVDAAVRTVQLLLNELAEPSCTNLQ